MKLFQNISLNLFQNLLNLLFVLKLIKTHLYEQVFLH